MWTRIFQKQNIVYSSSYEMKIFCDTMYFYSSKAIGVSANSFSPLFYSLLCISQILKNVWLFQQAANAILKLAFPYTIIT